MDTCKILYSMRRDEASGILAYNKLKTTMPAEHTEHIAMIETYIGQEYDHLQGVEKMMTDMKCGEPTPQQEIHIIAHDIYEKANEIERIARKLGDENIHKLVESIEHETFVIKDITKVKE